MQQTTKNMGSAGWIWFLNRWSYLEHLHSTNLYCYSCQILATQKFPTWSHSDRSPWDCTGRSSKATHCTARYTPDSPTFLGLFQKPQNEPPRKHNPTYYLPHMQVAFVWRFIFSNTKSNTSWRTKIIIKYFTT